MIHLSRDVAYDLTNMIYRRKLYSEYDIKLNSMIRKQNKEPIYEEHIGFIQNIDILVL